MMKDDNMLGLMGMLYGELSEEETQRWRKKIGQSPELKREWEALQETRLQLDKINRQESPIPAGVFPVKQQQPIWGQNLFRYAATVVLVVGCLLVLGKFSGFHVTSGNEGIFIGFVQSVESPSPVVNEVLHENQLEIFAQVVEQRFKEQEASLIKALEAKIAEQEPPLRDASREVVRQELARNFQSLSKEWVNRQMDWTERHFAENQMVQYRYLEAMANEMVILVRQMQEEDIQELHQKMIGMEQENSDFQSNTQDLLEKLLNNLGTFEHQ
jgi:hypothetical protein